MPLASVESTLYVCHCSLLVNLGVLRRESSRVGKMGLCEMLQCVAALTPAGVALPNWLHF